MANLWDCPLVLKLRIAPTKQMKDVKDDVDGWFLIDQARLTGDDDGRFSSSISGGN